MTVEHLTNTLVQGTSLILLVMLCGEVILSDRDDDVAGDHEGMGQEVTIHLERNRE
jgi:hypothetical protein